MPTAPILIRNYLHPDPPLRQLLLVDGEHVHVAEPPLLDVLGTFLDDRNGGLIAAARSSAGFGYIDGKGRWLVAPTLQAARTHSPDGLARFQKGGVWGYCDLGGEVVIAPQFEDAAAFRYGLAAVLTEAGWRYIDTNGVPAFDKTFAHAGEFGKVGLAFARQASFGKYGCIDRAGNWAIAPQYCYMSGFADKAWAPAALSRDAAGFIDANGKWVVQPAYSRTDAFNPDGYAFFRPAGSFMQGGYLDRAGREVIPPGEDISDFMQCGLALLDDHRHIGVEAILSTTTPLRWTTHFTSDGFTVAREYAGPREYLSDRWGILRSDGSFRPAPAGVLEPVTSKSGEFVWPEPGTPLAPFLTEDGNLVLLDEDGVIVYRMERDTHGAHETIVLRGTDARVLWKSEPCVAARIAPFFDPQPEALLEHLDSFGDVVGLAESLVAQTRAKLAALAAGDYVPVLDEVRSNSWDRRNQDEDEYEQNRDDADSEPLGAPAQVRTSQRVFRTFIEESTWGSYQFLSEARLCLMERANSALLTVLTNAFGIPVKDPDCAGRPPGENTSAWAIGEDPHRLWIGLRPHHGTMGGTFWCHIWLHCAPSKASLQRALAASPTPYPDSEGGEYDD